MIPSHCDMPHFLQFLLFRARPATERRGWSRPSLSDRLSALKFISKPTRR